MPRWRPPFSAASNASRPPVTGRRGIGSTTNVGGSPITGTRTRGRPAGSSTRGATSSTSTEKRGSPSVSERPRILLAGGYGVFGRLLARELLDTMDAHLVLAGPSARRAEQARVLLGSPDRTEPLGLDLSDTEAVEHAAIGCFAVACTAGPFQELPVGLAGAAVRAGAHWVDVADDRGWVLGVLDDADLHTAARERGVCVIPGLSTAPAVSGALARW